MCSLISCLIFYPSKIEALPEVVDAVRGKGIDVYMDGGVRSGSDVAKAIGLGAKMVFVGRPFLWALAVEVCRCWHLNHYIAFNL